MNQTVANPGKFLLTAMNNETEQGFNTFLALGIWDPLISYHILRNPLHLVEDQQHEPFSNISHWTNDIFCHCFCIQDGASVWQKVLVSAYILLAPGKM